jgi:hypothetical protein
MYPPAGLCTFIRSRVGPFCSIELLGAVVPLGSMNWKADVPCVA